jgi:anti-sigma B factor antagonist
MTAPCQKRCRRRDTPELRLRPGKAPLLAHHDEYFLALAGPLGVIRLSARRIEGRWRRPLSRARRADRNKQTHPYLRVGANVDEQGDTVVTLSGELDLHSGAWLAAQSAGIVARPSGAVLDVAGVSFIDASGLRSLISLVGRLDSGQQRVALRSPSPALMRLLELLDMRDRFVVIAERGTR